MTLAVSPKEVDKLVAARARGSLTLALRGPNDHEAEARAAAPAAPAAPAPSPARLADPQGLAAPGPQQIREGMRAYAIEVNEQPDVGWLVLPGDHVDVVSGQLSRAATRV